MGESSFWYRPTRVVPDQRLLNGRCLLLYSIITGLQISSPKSMFLEMYSRNFLFNGLVHPSSFQVLHIVGINWRVLCCNSCLKVNHMVSVSLCSGKRSSFQFIGILCLIRLGWRPPGLSVPLPPFSSSAPQNAAQPYAKAEGCVYEDPSRADGLRKG